MMSLQQLTIFKLRQNQKRDNRYAFILDRENVNIIILHNIRRGFSSKLMAEKYVYNDSQEHVDWV